MFIQTIIIYSIYIGNCCPHRSLCSGYILKCDINKGQKRSKHGIVWHTKYRYNGSVESRAEMPGFFNVRGLAMTQKEFYKTMAWRRARHDYIAYRKAIDGGLCEVCGEEPGRIVHHVIWLDDTNCNDPEISLNPSNFKYECQTCHNKENDPRKATPGRCLYGPNGEIIRNSAW